MYIHTNMYTMMMIAFITIGSLVPWLKVYAAQIRFRFELSVLLSLLLLCFFGRKHMLKEKKQLDQISSRIPACINTCVLYTHIRIHICQDFVHLDYLGPPDVASRPLGLHPVPRVQCVCVCTYTHTYACVHSHPASKIEKTQDNTSISQTCTVMSKTPVECTHLHALVPRTPV